MADLERDLAHFGRALRRRAPEVEVDEIRARIARPVVHTHPARSAATGAALVLASIGLLFLTLSLVGIASGEDRRFVETVAGPTDGWPMGIAAMALATGGGALVVLAGAAVMGLRRRYVTHQPLRDAKQRERRKKKMQTLEKPIAPVEKLERTNKYLIIGLVVAVLLAIGLGAWLYAGNTRTSVERDIISLLDEYWAAWEAEDSASVSALMTETASADLGGAMLVGPTIRNLVESFGFDGRKVGGPVIVEVDQPGINPGWQVAQAVLMDDRYHIIDLFKVVESDGNYLIAYHETWQPFAP